jgi:hypothetical protein
MFDTASVEQAGFDQVERHSVVVPNDRRIGTIVRVIPNKGGLDIFTVLSGRVLRFLLEHDYVIRVSPSSCEV